MHFFRRIKQENRNNFKSLGTSRKFDRELYFLNRFINKTFSSFLGRNRGNKGVQFWKKNAC